MAKKKLPMTMYLVYLITPPCITDKVWKLKRDKYIDNQFYSTEPHNKLGDRLVISSPGNSNQMLFRTKLQAEYFYKGVKALRRHLANQLSK